MRDAAVGHQCVECVEAGARTVRRPGVGGRGSGLPVVTYALIAVNLAAFVAETASKDVERRYVLWPPAVADGQVDRLVTSAFLHFGLTHLMFNMVALYFGIKVVECKYAVKLLLDVAMHGTCIISLKPQALPLCELE
jgi:membrane associated rhomboid family serine protease